MVSRRQSTLRMVLLSQLGVLMFVLKLAMAGLPNIEPVSLLVMVYTVVLGKWALVPIYLYVVLEYLVWGINIWSLCYIYIWLLLWGISMLMRRTESLLYWAVLGAGFGIGFGAMCALVYIPISGLTYAITWWFSGIPFDLLHCGGNFVLVLVLFKPLRRLMEKAMKRLGIPLPSQRKTEQPES